MESFKFFPQITQIYEFGVKKGDYYVTMKKYRISLKEWRNK